MIKNILILLLISSATFAQKEEYDFVYTSNETGNHELFLGRLDRKYKKQITNYELRDGYAAVSPDGKQVAFYAYYDGGKTWCIHIMDLNGKNRKRLTYKKDVFDSAPKWSPDGKYIIFSRKEGDAYKVMMMKPDGSKLHQLNLPYALHPNFTKDYKVVYASHWNETGDIFIADSTGQNNKQLTNTNGADGHPYISPDGSKVVFFSMRNGDKDVYTMNLDGSNQKRITSMKGDEWDVSWSPDGNRITFISLIERRYNNFIVNSDGTELRNISNSEWSESGISWISK